MEFSRMESTFSYAASESNGTILYLGHDRSNSGETSHRNGRRYYDSLPCLVVSRLEKIPLKDFSSEVRANLDIEKFLKEATLLLDIDGNSIECIIEQMLISIFNADAESNNNKDTEGWMDARVQEAKKTLFLQATYLNHSYQRLAKTIKSISITEAETEALAPDQTWLCTMCSINSVQKRHVAIARLRNPVNLGKASEGVSFVLLIVTPTKEKGTKSDIELGRTFATLLADMEFRQHLLLAENNSEFKEMLQNHARELGEEQKMFRRKSLKTKDLMEQAFNYENNWVVFNGMRSDLRKRIPYYPSDFLDGIFGKQTIIKTLSTITFLYFACLLPSIAFGVLNEDNTNEMIDVQRVILSQALGGLAFAFLGGQPLIVMQTTAPLALYTKVIYTISQQYGLDFYALFGWVGVFNSLLLMIYASVDMSKLMRWSTRSTEEIFALFVSIAFIVGAFKHIADNFNRNYYSCDHNSTIGANSSLSNQTNITTDKPFVCQRECSILYLLLCFGTVWLAMYLLNFTKTPYLNKAKRELMADFSIPVAALVMSFFGSYVFRAIKLIAFECSHINSGIEFVMAKPLPWLAILGAFGLAIPLSMLFFMDQNISSAMVNAPSNKLKKGSAYHWDLFMVGLINGVLSMFALPWLHGALPHSPMHVKALADLEERIDAGQHVHQTVVRVRETRLTGIFSNLLIGLSIFLCPKPLSYIPIPVLDGLFICMAVSSVFGNQLFERILLLVTEQSAYPPSHYLRRVPQRKVHIFTLLQIIQLGVLCALGFNPSPYAKMGFPVILLLQMPIRHYLIPKFIAENYLEALDKPI